MAIRASRYMAMLMALLVCIDSARSGDDTQTSAALRSIRELLTDMTVAVESGDIGDYLSHIAPQDVTYLTEQRNWAADLREHPVHEFEIRLVDSSELTVSEHGWAVGQVAMRWRMGEFDPRRTVRFPARFVPAGEPDGEWFYAGEHWRVVYDDRHGAPNRAMALDKHESVALQIVEVLPGVRERVDELFGITNQREVQVKVYESMEHLQASIYLSYEDPLGGWNEPGESIKLLAGPSLEPRNLRRLLGHEYGHAATFLLGERVDDAPWWALEGIAELASVAVIEQGGARERMVRRWKTAGTLKEWRQLADFRGEAGMYGQWVYVQGWSMVAYITDRFGGRARNDWITLLVSGDSLDAATRRALGVGFAELDAAWRDSIEPFETEREVEAPSIPELMPEAAPEKSGETRDAGAGEG